MAKLINIAADAAQRLDRHHYQGFIGILSAGSCPKGGVAERFQMADALNMKKNTRGSEKGIKARGGKEPCASHSPAHLLAGPALRQLLILNQSKLKLTPLFSFVSSLFSFARRVPPGTAEHARRSGRGGTDGMRCTARFTRAANLVAEERTNAEPERGRWRCQQAHPHRRWRQSGHTGCTSIG